MFLNSSVMEKGIASILELSADAHIQRRQAVTSSAYHKFTGMIAAYGKALALLTALHRLEELYFVVGHAGQHTSLPESLPSVG